MARLPKRDAISGARSFSLRSIGSDHGVLLPLLGSQGPLAMFSLIAAALLISIVLIVFAGPPGLAKQPVE